MTQCKAANATDVAIADNGTVESLLAVAGCSGTASATAQIDVDIVHTFVGDLVVSLIAPDGSVYVLRNRTGGSAGTTSSRPSL